MNVRYLVTLAPEEKSQLEAMVGGGTQRVRHVKRAKILLAAHGGATDEQIVSSVRVGTSTVYRVKRRFVEGGVEHALHERQRPGASRKLTGRQEAGGAAGGHGLLSSSEGTGALNAPAARRRDGEPHRV